MKFKLDWQIYQIWWLVGILTATDIFFIDSLSSINLVLLCLNWVFAGLALGINIAKIKVNEAHKMTEIILNVMDEIRKDMRRQQTEE